jgi:phage shock protein C
MDKIITINLGGYAIKIEEDAYEALKTYIRKIEETFANTENGKEIINDIEARIAEMLTEKTQGKVSANLFDVEFVKKEMGNPGEFESEDSEKSGNKTEIPHETIRRRLYRDPDNTVFGGVCSGISHYFNIDPVIVRLIWFGLIFFFGTGILIYFILWVIVPEAITTAQKLEMKGEAPTLDNIVNRVKTEAEKVEQNLKSQNFGQRFQHFFKSISPIFLNIFKAISMLASLILLVLLTLIIIALLSGKGSLNYNHNEFAFHNIPNFFDNSWQFLSFKILVGLLLCIPLFNVLISLLKFVFNSKLNYRPIGKFLGWIWVATLPFLIYFIYLGVNNFKSRQTVSTESKEMIQGELIIKADFNTEDNFYKNIDMEIEPSVDSLIHIIINQTANGKTVREAEKLAEKNGASYTIKGNTLTLKSADKFEELGIFRGQSVDFIIQIPNKIPFKLDPSVQKNGVRVNGQNITYYSDIHNHNNESLVFISHSLFCPICPDSIPIGSASLSSFSNFNRIKANGIMDIEILRGNTFSIQKNGSKNVIDKLEMWESGSVLNIELDDEYFFIKSRPKIIITLPMLENLELSGSINCRMDHFAGDELNLNLSGASKAKMEAEFDKINANLSGVSHLNIGGNAKTLNFNASGKS